MSIKRYTKGGVQSAAQINEQVDQINRQKVVAGRGIDLHQLSIGTAISLNKRFEQQHIVHTGQISALGPNSEADFTDYRYYVRLTLNSTTGANEDWDKVLNMEEVPVPTVGEKDHIVAAYNLSELLDGTHSLVEDTPVLLVSIWADYPTTEDVISHSRWFIVGGPSTLPSGTHEHQHYLMTSANQSGWSFPRLHGLLNES